MPDDHVIGLDEETAADQGDSRRGGGFAGHERERLVDPQGLALEVDDSAYFENHQARAFFAEGRPERTRPLSVQAVDAEDLRPGQGEEVDLSGDRGGVSVDWSDHWCDLTRRVRQGLRTRDSGQMACQYYEYDSHEGF